MPISFQCPRCAKPYVTSDETAGKRARCKKCGNTMTIPRPGDADLYALAEPEVPPLPSQAFDDEDELPRRRPTYERSKAKAANTSGGTSAKTIGGVVSILTVVGIIAVKIVLRLALSHFGGRGNAQPNAPAAPPVVAANLNGPIALPNFPDPGPGRPLMPGVEFHEIHLPGGPQPGFGGKLWLYLPSGAQPDKSLPCVLITGAGSNLLVGMDLGDGDRPEHLPYVQAGFAVLAFELDGAVPNLQNANDAQIFGGAQRFLAARAGLVNAHIALEYALAKVPQVNPDQIYAAGHSSAGTLALLFAEHEPRLKGCVAFAPAIDLVKRFGASMLLLRLKGLTDLAERYSPKTNEAKLSCPLFLFHAQDDSNVPVGDSTQFADRLRQLGKTVTLEVVPTGNHYNSMIQQGIPRAIAWIQGQSGFTPVQAQAAAPVTAPVPGAGPIPFAPPNANGFAGPPGTGGFPPPSPNGPNPRRMPPFRRPGRRPPQMIPRPN